MLQAIWYVVLGIAAGAISTLRRRAHKSATVEGSLGAIEGFLLAATQAWSVPGAVATERVVKAFAGEKQTVGDKISIGTMAFAAALLPKDIWGLILVAAGGVDAIVGAPIVQIVIGGALAAMGQMWVISLVAYQATRWIIDTVMLGAAQPLK